MTLSRGKRQRINELLSFEQSQPNDKAVKVELIMLTLQDSKAMEYVEQQRKTRKQRKLARLIGGAFTKSMCNTEKKQYVRDLAYKTVRAKICNNSDGDALYSELRKFLRHPDEEVQDHAQGVLLKAASELQKIGKQEVC